MSRSHTANDELRKVEERERALDRRVADQEEKVEQLKRLGCATQEKERKVFEALMVELERELVQLGRLEAQRMVLGMRFTFLALASK